jgi:antitoxin HigA-1
MPRIPTHRAPTHPGTILLHQFIEPMNLTQAEVARAIHVPYQRLNEVIRGVRALTPETALRLAKYFGTTPTLWLNLQLARDLYEAQKREAQALEQIEPVDA